MKRNLFRMFILCSFIFILTQSYSLDIFNASAQGNTNAIMKSIRAGFDVNARDNLAYSLNVGSL